MDFLASLWFPFLPSIDYNMRFFGIGNHPKYKVFYIISCGIVLASLM